MEILNLTAEQIQLFKALGGLTVTFGLFGLVGYGIKKLVDFLPTNKLNKLF